MSNDLLTQLEDYGRYHREEQQPVAISEVGVPVVGPAPLQRRSPRTRWLVPLAAAVAVIALFAIPSLVRDPAAGSPATQVEDTRLEAEGLTSVHRVPQTGDLVALRDRRLVMSSNGGEDWRQVALGEYVLMAVAPDGSVVAVSPQRHAEEPVGPGSEGSDTPTVLRFDPTTGEGNTVELPRPAMPEGDLSPARVGGSCVPGGLRSEVFPIAAASGPQVAIVADHRITTADICNETRQFIWTSTDGLSWSIVPDIDIDHYVSGLLWDGEKYVAYGSSERAYHRTSDARLFAWTSTDLASMTPQPVDQPSLDEDEILYVPTEAEGNDDGQQTIWVDSSSGSVVVAVERLRYRPGLEDVTDAAQLAAWLRESGADPQVDTLDQTLDLLNVDFPLDEDEIDTIRANFVVAESVGYVDLPTDIGVKQ